MKKAKNAKKTPRPAALYADTGGRCTSCGELMNGVKGRRRAIVNGVRSLDLCNLCLNLRMLTKPM